MKHTHQARPPASSRPSPSLTTPEQVSRRLALRRMAGWSVAGAVGTVGMGGALSLLPEMQAFAQSPLLRHSYPLLLDSDGRAQLDDRLLVQLDRELGLVYRNRE